MLSESGHIKTEIPFIWHPGKGKTLGTENSSSCLAQKIKEGDSL